MPLSPTELRAAAFRGDVHDQLAAPAYRLGRDIVRKPVAQVKKIQRFLSDVNLGSIRLDTHGPAAALLAMRLASAWPAINAAFGRLIDAMYRDKEAARNEARTLYRIVSESLLQGEE